MALPNLLNLAVLLVAGVVLVFTLAIGLFLNYHWNKYEFNRKKVNQRRAIFIVVSLVLSLSMFYLIYLL